MQKRLDAGEPHVIRFNMPTEGTTTFHDVIYGDITVNNEEMEDLILIKSDGYPTYNFAESYSGTSSKKSIRAGISGNVSILV